MVVLRCSLFRVARLRVLPTEARRRSSCGRPRRTRSLAKFPYMQYADVQLRSAKNAPVVDVCIEGPHCVHRSSLGQGKGTGASQGRLVYHSFGQLWTSSLVVIRAHARVLTFRPHVWLLQHVQVCFFCTAGRLHFASAHSVHVGVCKATLDIIPAGGIRGRRGRSLFVTLLVALHASALS